MSVIVAGGGGEKRRAEVTRPAGKHPTLYLLVVQVGEVDAVDFNNLVPCLEEKLRGISVFALPAPSLICREGSPWGTRADTGP